MFLLFVLQRRMADDNSSRLSSTRFEGKFMAMLACWFLGLGTLVSWNSMLTIGDYYYQVFPNYHPARVLTLVYMPFALGTIIILAYYEARVDTRIRNLIGYILFTLGTLGLLLIDLGTSGKGGIANYIGICVFVAAFGVGDALVEGGMIGDLSFMCPEFNQSFVAGLAASGALISSLRLITKAAFDKTNNGLRKGVMLFLSMSTVLQLICIFLYAFVFGKLPIVKYFRKKAAVEGSSTVSADLAAVGIHGSDKEREEHERLTNKQLLVQNIDYAIDMFVIYLLSLSIFPGFLYENTGNHQLGSWYSVVLVTIYNVFDFIGRSIPIINAIKLEERCSLMVACFARLFLVPCFYFTAKYGDQGWMLFLVSFLGITNGYLTVCVFTGAPKGYKAPEQNALGNLMVLFLLGGVLVGVALDWIWIIGKASF